MDLGILFQLLSRKQLVGFFHGHYLSILFHPPNELRPTAWGQQLAMIAPNHGSMVVVYGHM